MQRKVIYVDSAPWKAGRKGEFERRYTGGVAVAERLGTKERDVHKFSGWDGQGKEEKLDYEI